MPEKTFKVHRDQEILEINNRMSVLPLKDVVVFPYMIFPLLVGRESSLRAVQEAMLANKMIFLATQKDLTTENPDRDELFRVGVIARILQILKLPNGLMKVLVEGLVRGKIRRFLPPSDHFQGFVEVYSDVHEHGMESAAIMRKARKLFHDYVQANANIPDEVLLQLEGMRTPEQLAFYISAHLQREVILKQTLLEENDVMDQLLLLVEFLESEKEILQLEKNIDEKVRGRISKSQRLFFLQEQMRVIQEELGEEATADSELGALREKIVRSKMPKPAEEKAFEEWDKLKLMAPLSPESTVIRNYLDWLVSVPWREKTKDRLNIDQAQKILDEDHYGLKKPKERILEHLAVLKLVKKMKGPILCLAGPPGVGKTSLGRSIARAMGRKFVRISLGGVRDEAEIRGHRRTYIGSMPGRIVQSMKKAGAVNPVFLLDEVDKMNADFRGDPSSALLEVLDPEQNVAFNDHYLEVDYDLSQVLFVTTANVRSQIPEPLKDRMEIIDLPGYLEHEKYAIAHDYLIPKLLKNHGLKKADTIFTRPAIIKIIREYTKEAGVRNLERELGSICRKIAKLKVGDSKKTQKFRVTSAHVEQFLGAPKYKSKSRFVSNGPGSALGLAWTRYGGDILELEVNVLAGKGGLTLTGKLGEVMKESAKAALSYIRSRSDFLKIDPDFWKEKDLHLHIPEGAISKDGPSAGITIAVAMISALTGKSVNENVAMTGEITLSGKVLPIGGLNEKLLAAQRVGVKKVLIPQENEPEFKELPPEVKKGLEVVQVSHMDQVLPLTIAG